IAEEIEQDLPQPHGVHGQCAEVLLGVDDEVVLVLLGQLSGGADYLVDQRCKLHGLRVEFELSGLDLRQVEHLVDEAEQVSTSAVHALQRLLQMPCVSARKSERGLKAEMKTPSATIFASAKSPTRCRQNTGIGRVRN